MYSLSEILQGGFSMKKMSKRLVIIALLIGVGCISSTYASILHSIKSEEVITKGATHINEKLLTDKGWRNVNILKIDLADSNILVKPMESATGLERQNILQMVQESGAVAGVNADYFDMGSTNSPSLGMLIENGNLLHAYNSSFSSLGINKNMATFMIDQSNLPSMAYYGVKVNISADGILVGEAGTKNIVPTSVKKPVILDRKYYETTNDIVVKHPTLYTIVVENGQVTYHSQSGESVTIPDNGYVILVPEDTANMYYTSLPIGALVSIDETLYLNNGLTTAVSNMKLGIGGSGIIMKNGEAYTGGAHAVTPTADVARTVVASVKGTNEILLVTVDKTSEYVGINQSELIELLKRYNVQDAMYFDGGGSTTFVARNEGELSPSLQNHPTGGEQRKVINGVGVYSASQTGNLANLKIMPTSLDAFVGETVSFTVKGTDENNNPVPIDASEVTYTLASGEGHFSGNIFTPTKAGSSLVVASCKGVEVGIELNVEEAPKGLQIEPSLLQIDANSTKSFQVYGINSKGNKVPLSSDKLTWTSHEPSISVSQGMVSSQGECIGKITADYKGIKSEAGVVVGKTTIAVDSLETNSAKWGGDTNEVKGSVFPCDNPVYEGSRSLKMTYTFSASTNKQVAYTVFDIPIPVREDASRVNMWLYGKGQGHAAKIEMVDNTGKTYYLKLTDNINFSGWKFVSAIIPDEAVLPAKVTKFYTYANVVNEKLTTAVYIDHISVTRGFRNSAGIAARADYLFDPFYKESLGAPIGNQYIINVVGATRSDSMLLNSESISDMSKKLAEGASVVVKASTKNSQLSLNTSQYTYANTYEDATYKNTKIIMIGTGSGGIRTTDTAGWSKAKASIESSSEAKNIILIMSLNPLTQFSDAKEGKAFHDYLVETKKQTGQNIFVVYAGGKEPEVRIEEGIRYIRTNGIDVTTDSYKEGSFIKFKMDGDAVYYTIEKLK